jgi:hypothetical protein
MVKIKTMKFPLGLLVVAVVFELQESTKFKFNVIIMFTGGHRNS